MELVREENGKKIFVDGDRSYTMIDMGSYVGHMYRDWYEAAPEVWILMQSDDGNSKIESLVDSNGQYIRFVADEGNVRRIIATGISGLHSRRTRGDRHSSRVEAKNPALLSNRDGYLLELTGWTQGSQAS